MKVFLLIIFSAISFHSNCQKSLTITVKNIDNLIFLINKEKNDSLKDCLTISDINNNKTYKCYTYFFSDTSIKEICKIEISFDGLNEFICYYKNNKVINVQQNKITKGKIRQEWSDYISYDKEVFFKRNKVDIEKNKKSIWISENKVEQAYYLLDQAFEYTKKVRNN